MFSQLHSQMKRLRCFGSLFFTRHEMKIPCYIQADYERPIISCYISKPSKTKVLSEVCLEISLYSWPTLYPTRIHSCLLIIYDV